MRKLHALMIAAATFAIGIAVSNVAMSDVASPKIAVVDVSSVVSKSAQVQALKKEQQAKMQDLQKWLQTAKVDVQKQQTEDGKKKLLAKYDDEFAKKRSTLIKDYQDKLKKIDKNISDTIASQAKAQGYDLILSKSAVLYGGSDITESVSKNVK